MTAGVPPAALRTLAPVPPISMTSGFGLVFEGCSIVTIN